MKHGQNRRRYRAIARTEQAAERNQATADHYNGRGMDEIAEGYARRAARQRAEAETLMRRVDFSDPYLNR